MNTETYNAIVAKLNAAQEALSPVISLLYAGVAIGDANETPLITVMNRLTDIGELLDDVELD